MNIHSFLRFNAENTNKALPILSFPAVEKLNVSVKDLILSSDLQAKAMAIVANETDTLAAVSLMDLSVEAEAFGAAVRFPENEVPAVTGTLIFDEEDAFALEIPSLDKGRAKICIEGIKKAKQLISEKPVFAGLIGPFSLAGRLMDVTEIMYVCFDEPETVHTVLEKATAYLIDYGKALKAAGADAILMAEPLAGILSPQMAIEFSVPYVKKIIEALQDEEFAVIYHNCGNSVISMLEELFSQGAAAYHFGNAVSMKEVLSLADENIICMGNIDPVKHFTNSSAKEMTAAVKELLSECGEYKNFILSSGCDIPAAAKWENINAFFEALRV